MKRLWCLRIQSTADQETRHYKHQTVYVTTWLNCTIIQTGSLFSIQRQNMCPKWCLTNCWNDCFTFSEKFLYYTATCIYGCRICNDVHVCCYNVLKHTWFIHIALIYFIMACIFVPRVESHIWRIIYHNTRNISSYLSLDTYITENDKINHGQKSH